MCFWRLPKVEVNKKSVVDMKIFQFNYKYFSVAATQKNLPLLPCKHIVHLSHFYWNRVKPVRNIKTQVMWEMNSVTPVHSPQCTPT